MGNLTGHHSPHQTYFKLKMLPLKTGYGNVLAGTTHLVQEKQRQERFGKLENLPLLALKLSEALICLDDL